MIFKSKKWKKYFKKLTKQFEVTVKIIMYQDFQLEHCMRGTKKIKLKKKYNIRIFVRIQYLLAV